MLHYHIFTPRHPDYRVRLSAYSEITPQDVAFHMAAASQDEAEGRRLARRRAWAAIANWIRRTGRDLSAPTALMEGGADR